MPETVDACDVTMEEAPSEGSVILPEGWEDLVAQIFEIKKQEVLWKDQLIRLEHVFAPQSTFQNNFREIDHALTPQKGALDVLCRKTGSVSPKNLERAKDLGVDLCDGFPTVSEGRTETLLQKVSGEQEEWNTQSPQVILGLSDKIESEIVAAMEALLEEKQRIQEAATSVMSNINTLLEKIQGEKKIIEAWPGSPPELWMGRWFDQLVGLVSELRIQMEVAKIVLEKDRETENGRD